MMNEWMNEKKKVLWFRSKFCQMKFKWDKFICISKNRDVIFSNWKKSDLVWKFWNFRSKTRARRDLFFMRFEFWFKDASEKKPFFDLFWNFVQKHRRGERLFFDEVRQIYGRFPLNFRNFGSDNFTGNFHLILGTLVQKYKRRKAFF